MDRQQQSRREFLGWVAASTASAIAAPAVHGSDKSGSRVLVGEGDYRYAANHAWAQLPSQFHWQTTHNVAVDREGLVYVIHEGDAAKRDHPAIFVFDESGKYVRSFGRQFQGGGHGLEVREEDGDEFLYVTGYQHLKTFAKLDKKGEVVWQKFAPMKAGVYAKGEDTAPKKVWGRDRFMPTNFAFLPDGGFLLADGYGSFFIHRYNRAGEWQSAFGGPGDGKGKFNTPHGLWIDARPGREPAVVVTDRAHHTLQYFTLEGKYLTTIPGVGLPANIDTWGELMLVPELFGSVSLFDRNNKVLARLGDDAARIKADTKMSIRSNPSEWRAGRFVHPHDACFDRAGNIYVAEWVATGRVTKLTRV